MQGSGNANGASTAGSSGDHVELTDEKLQSVRNKDEGKHGCAHYRRRCKLVAPCCGEVFWCRHCHNEEKYTAEWVSEAGYSRA